MFSNRLAQFRHSSGRRVMRPASLHGMNTGLDDVGRGIKVRLTDFQVDDVPALGLQQASSIQDFKSALNAQARHALGQTQLGGRSNSLALHFGYP